ncbi:MAG: GNAT family N-acetyltransferase, partial [Pseudomonadota bacterium]
MDLHALDTVVIRPAVAADAPVVARIHGDAYDHTYGLTGDDLAEARAERAARWPRILGGETPPATVLVAVVAEEVVAFAASHPVRDDWNWEKLASLYATPAFHGTGIATLLMRELADRLMAVGRRRLRGSVLAENHRARAFYARLGAEEVREEPDALAGRPVTNIVLEWPRLADLARAARAGLDRRLAPPVAVGWRDVALEAGAPHPAGVADEAKGRA